MKLKYRGIGADSKATSGFHPNFISCAKECAPYKIGKGFS
jgi:hypothetical protein